MDRGHGSTLDDPTNKTLNEQTNLNFMLAGHDTDTGPGAKNILTYSIMSGSQSGMSIDPVTGVFNWTPSELQDGSYTVTFKVADNGTPSLSATRTITIQVNETNSAPALANPGPQSINEKTLLSFTLTAPDSDVVAGIADTVTYSISSGSQSGMSVDPSTGVFAWTPTEAQDGIYNVTFRATDNHGAFNEQSIVITVGEVNAAPTLDDPGSPSTIIGCDLGLMSVSRARALVVQASSLHRLGRLQA